MTFDEQIGTLAGGCLVLAAVLGLFLVGLWTLKRLMPYIIGVLLWLGWIE